MVETPISSKGCAWPRIFCFSVFFVAITVVTGHLSLPMAEAAQASLTWTAPTTNTDGTPITDLAGFKLYVGNASGSYQQSVDVGNQTSYTLSTLNDGATYYFAATAYDTGRVESAFSSEVTKSFPALYIITATSGSGGTIAAVNNANINQASNGTTMVTSVTVNDGASQTFTIAATTGFRILDVAVDGTSVGPVASYTFTGVTANHTIAATFGHNSYTITASAGSGGSITPSGATALNYGAGQAYTITAATGYGIADVKVDGVSVGTIASYSFASVSANHTISATFALNNYTITASAGAGGSITPSGAAALNYGASQTYTIAATIGYGIADVKVDGVSVGPVASYSFASVSVKHTIAATFVLNSYTIAASAGSGGSISPTGVTTLNYGNGQVYTITAATGYEIADVKVDGVSVGPVFSYSFASVSANHTIGATFVINNYKITASAGVGGSISPSGATTLNDGASQSYTIVPATGYRIVDVKVDGVSVGAINNYNFGNIKAIHTIVVAFAVNSYSISALSNATGTISPSGTTAVNWGGSQTYTITPSVGYHVAGVTVDGSSVGAVGNFSFSNVTANHSITANFAINTYTVTASASTGGSISPAGISTVNYGGSKKYSVVPAAGYHIANVTLDGHSVGTVTNYTFSKVIANHIIVATFAVNARNSGR